MTPEQQAAYALDFNVSRNDLSPTVQAEYDRLKQERSAVLQGLQGSEPDTEEKRTGRETREARRERQAANRAATAGMSLRDKLDHYGLFPALGVRVTDGMVFDLRGKRQLGPLAGARVEVTAGSAGLSRMARASAFVIFADGSVPHEKRLTGVHIASAQSEAVRFRLLVERQHSAAGDSSEEL
jgi:hypothetical protein